MSKPRALSRQRGLALVVVLWASVILALIAGVVTRLARDDLTETRLMEEALRAELAADSAAALAAHELASGAWAVGESRSWRFAGAELRVETWDEAGRLDLNAGRLDLLAALLEEAGAEAPGRIAEAAEAARDAAEGAPAFAMVEDLADLPGADPTLVAAAAPYLTVHTGAALPYAEAAAPMVQDAIEALDLPDPGPSERPVVRIHAEARTDGAVRALLTVIALPGSAAERPRTLLRMAAPRRLF